MRLFNPIFLAISSFVLLGIVLIYTGSKIYSSYQPKGSLVIQVNICESDLSSESIFIRIPVKILNKSKQVYSYDKYDASGKDSIPNLTFGEYTIKYKNSFNQKFEKKVNINSPLTGFELCIDELSEEFIATSFHDFLATNSEVWEISQESSGCFHHGVENLSVKRKGSAFEVSYKREATWEDYKDAAMLSDDGFWKWTIELEEEDLKAIEEFEKRIILLDNQGACTSSNKYQIKSKGKEILIKERTCAYSYGWPNMIHSLESKSSQGK